MIPLTQGMKTTTTRSRMTKNTSRANINVWGLLLPLPSAAFICRPAVFVPCSSSFCSAASSVVGRCS